VEQGRRAFGVVGHDVELDILRGSSAARRSQSAIARWAALGHGCEERRADRASRRELFGVPQDLEIEAPWRTLVDVRLADASQLARGEQVDRDVALELLGVAQRQDAVATTSSLSSFEPPIAICPLATASRNAARRTPGSSLDSSEPAEPVTEPPRAAGS